MLTIEDILATGSSSGLDFESAALEVFRFQAARCEPYARYLSLIGCEPSQVDRTEKIPYLPIELFKTHDVYCGSRPPQITFTSSTTGGGIPARHMMQDVYDYERTFNAIFSSFYGSPQDVAIFALLPGYLQRQGSSLVYMVDRLIAAGGGTDNVKRSADNPANACHASGVGGFFLDDYLGLLTAMQQCGKPKILLGVSYALWDLAEKYPCDLHDTIIMETGGMKGNRPELPRRRFHDILCKAFGCKTIHSEYGMAELTSQAYSSGCGIFHTPPWMRVTARDLNDPFESKPYATGGAINIADLANLSSCAFLQTQDLGTVYADGSFTITGRAGRSEIRGCNLLVQ